MAKSRKIPDLTLDQERAAALAQAAEATRRAQELEGTNPSYLSGVTLDPGGAATPQTINAAIAKALGAEVPPTRGPGYRFPQTGPEGATGYGYAKPTDELKVRSYYFDQPRLTPEQMRSLRDLLVAERAASLGNIPAPITGRAMGFDTAGLPDVRLADEAQLGGDFPVIPPNQNPWASTIGMKPEYRGGTPQQLGEKGLLNRTAQPDLLGRDGTDTLYEVDPRPSTLQPNDIDYVDAGGSSPLPDEVARQKAAADAAAAAKKAQGAEGDSPIEPKKDAAPAPPGKSYAPSALLKRMGVAMRPGKLLKDYAWPVAREVGATAILGAGGVYAPSLVARLVRGYGPSAANWVKESWFPPGEEQPAQAQPQAGQPADQPSYIPPPQQEGQGGPRPQYLENLRRSRYQIGDPNSSDIIRTLTQSRGMA
jgi:hypothetical protein